MQPQPGDVVVQNKRGLDAFPGTDLEARDTSETLPRHCRDTSETSATPREQAQLKANGIETVVLAATSPLPPGAFSEPSEPGRCVGCAGRVPHQLLR